MLKNNGERENKRAVCSSHFPSLCFGGVAQRASKHRASPTQKIRAHLETGSTGAHTTGCWTMPGGRAAGIFTAPSPKSCPAASPTPAAGYPCSGQKPPSIFGCKKPGKSSTGSTIKKIRLTEKKLARGLPPPSVPSHQISPSYLHPHVPNSPSSFTVCS